MFEVSATTRYYAFTPSELTPSAISDLCANYGSPATDGADHFTTIAACWDDPETMTRLRGLKWTGNAGDTFAPVALSDGRVGNTAIFTSEFVDAAASGTAGITAEELTEAEFRALLSTGDV